MLVDDKNGALGFKFSIVLIPDSKSRIISKV